MIIQPDTATLQQPDAAMALEWIDTNGIGGFSSSTVSGCHTRRYHGLLVAATVPPAERMSLVSKLDETISIDGSRFELGTNRYGKILHPQGFRYATAFSKDLFPVFSYEAGGVSLEKTIAMVNGENTVLLVYNVRKAVTPFTLELLPLLSARNYHALQHANDSIRTDAVFREDVFSTTLYEGTPTIYIKIPGASYLPDPNWYYQFTYLQERERGQDDVEDLFSPGTFSIVLKEGDSLGVVVSTENPAGKDALKYLEKEMERRKRLLHGVTSPFVQQLTLAADQFIVQKNNIPALALDVSPAGGGVPEPGATVIAGYHWFTDWGRDTMISLPGLTLSTGRFTDAKKILSAFAEHVSMGMLPNRFQDNGEPPEYNTVDATLWYFVAIYKYLQATNNTTFVLHELLPVMQEIISWHFKGTRYQIHVDHDGLLYAGEQGQQLTWMDAKVDNWVVTPRTGKPVEIQALWYNALKTFASLLQLNNQSVEANSAEEAAAKTKKSFEEKFWYAEGNYLFDCIDQDNRPVNDLRPNQLFAISLPFPLLTGLKTKAVLQVIEKYLYTPVGLRSLAATDSRYRPVYTGDRFQRDGAYHQGTVWSWLLGPYADAMMTVPDYTGADGLQGKEKVQQVVSHFAFHLGEACIGSISEIFDGDAPHHPRGCIAQAWSVAEMIRIIKDYEVNTTAIGNSTQYLLT